MRKNISRGLFRLWIVLSGLWVAFFVAAVIADPCSVTIPVPEELWNPTPLSGPPGTYGPAVGPDAERFLNSCRGSSTKPFRIAIDRNVFGGPAHAVYRLLRVFFGPLPTIYGYVIMALGVPAAAFVFGTAVKWIVAGFKV
jgi:hypothetical protein